MGSFHKKKINLDHTGETKEELKAFNLIVLGVGVIIGTKIFVVTRVAANQDGLLIK